MTEAREGAFGRLPTVSRATQSGHATDRGVAGWLGNVADSSTKSGKPARTFRERGEIGMVGIIVGVSQASALDPIGDWQGSFPGDPRVQVADEVGSRIRMTMSSSRW